MMQRAGLPRATSTSLVESRHPLHGVCLWPRKVLLSVVAPCFNEAAGLPEFHRRVSAACRALPGLHDSWELVLINDGSRDTTRDVMQRLAWEDSHVVAINLARNYGHQVALTAGLNLCRGERS